MTRRHFIDSLFGATAGMLLSGCRAHSILDFLKSASDLHRLTPKPPLGWNSYDCCPGIDEDLALKNLEAFDKRLKPYGYEYFVLDAAWSGWSGSVRIDQYGRCVPTEIYFPHGLKPIIDAAHEKGIKFGVWMLRGIDGEAVKQNLPIKGTRYRAQDIVNVNDVCSWTPQNYGVDMNKAGAQEYYNSVVDLLAEWEIDFVKYDCIVPYPQEIEAIADAIAQCGRDIVLSLSPGDEINSAHLRSYFRANMLRITSDVWDKREDIAKAFDRWEMMQSFGGNGFWLDLDMIPFGYLRRDDRMDNFSAHQKRTFITQRALAASPLIMGGDLTRTDEFSFALITNREMLACNQNGVTGKLVYRRGHLDVWQTSHQSKPHRGWLGIFNRSESSTSFALNKQNLGLEAGRSYQFYHIWENQSFTDGNNFNFQIGADDVVFLRYQSVKSQSS